MHGEGVVYRDLKPENILIDKDGFVRITDFGLSKIIGEYTDMNIRSQTFCGTLEYMAPEMMKNSNYDSCVDWFSFGLVLFEMLSGKNPFKANATSSPNSD